MVATLGAPEGNFMIGGINLCSLGHTDKDLDGGAKFTTFVAPSLDLFVHVKGKASIPDSFNTASSISDALSSLFGS